MVKLETIYFAFRRVTLFCLVLAYSNQTKRHPPARPSASLRYSTNQAAAELASLRQSSPKTPDLSALLGMAAGGETQLSATVILSEAKNPVF